MEKRYLGLIILSMIIGFIFFLTFQYSNLKPTITGYTTINSSSFSSSSDFSGGTFSNVTTFGDDSIRLLFNPIGVGEYISTSLPYSLEGTVGLYVIGNFVYITSSTDDTFLIINVTNKSNPTPIGNFTNSILPYSLNGAKSPHIIGNFAYIPSAIDDTLTILNITNKSNPTPIGNFTNSILPYSLDNTQFLFVLGDFAYITAFADNSLTILNITNKSNPTPMGNYNDTVPPYSLEGIVHVYVSGDFAYTLSDTDDTLTILNITNKSNPIPIGNYNKSTPPYSLDSPTHSFVLGDYIYIGSQTDDSLTILNITNKSDPVPVGDYVDNVPPYSVDGARTPFVVGDYLYVSGFDDDSITILDITNKSSPVPVGDYVNNIPPYSVDNVISLFVQGDYLYAASNIDNALTILNINQTYLSGSYESPIINSSYNSSGSFTNATWYQVFWNETEKTGITNLSIQFRSCNDPACSGETYGNFYETSPASLNLNFNQYFQFNISFRTSNTSYTPKLHSINVSFSDDLINPSATFTCSPSTVTRGDTVVCTCSATDSGVGVNTSSISEVTTITTTQTGTFTQSGCTVKDLVGNTGTATGTYTVRSSSGSPSPTIQITQQVQSFLGITVEKGFTMNIVDEDIGIKEIEIQVTETIPLTKIIVQKYSAKPTQVSTEATGKIYKYIEIETTNLENKIEKVIVTIQVEKSWTLNNSLEKENIQMLKFDNNSDSWNELETIFDSEDDTFYFFKIELDSFSFFAITGTVVIEDTGTIDNIIDLGEGLMNNYGSITFWIFIGLLVIGIGMISFVVVYIIRKRKEEVN